VDDSLVIGMKYDWNDEDALYLAEAGYKRFVSWGQIQDFGTPLDFFKGYDANGNRIVGLIFKLNLEVND
jgi:hypothetical protein